MIGRINAAFDRLASVLIVISSVQYCLAVAALTLDIVLRAGFDSSITGLHEAIVTSFLYGFMFGTAALYIRQGDVVLTFFIDRLGEAFRGLLARVMQAVIAVTMTVVAYQTFVLGLAWHHMRGPALGMPRSVELLPIFIGALVIALTGLVRVFAPPPPAFEDFAQ